MNSKALSILDKSIRKISFAVQDLAGVVAVGTMLLTAAEVIARYFLRAPIVGAEDIMSLALCSMIFLPLASVEYSRSHIEVTILSSRFTPGVKLLLRCFGNILSAGLMTVLAWRAIKYASVSWVTGDSTMVLHIPRYAVLLIIAFGSALAVPSFISSLFHHGKELAKDKSRLGLWLIPVCVVALLILISPLLLERLLWEAGTLTIGLVGFLLLLMLLFLGLPIAVCMLMVGYICISVLDGFGNTLSVMSMVPYATSTEFNWIVLPLFILMGLLVFRTGLADDIYATANTWLSSLPGGLSIATIFGCAGMAAVCGDSLTTAMTMGKVSIPQMRKYKYDNELATGSVAAGGTLGILIPPSLGFIVYGLITDTSIGRLFIAGIIPGIMLSSMFMALIYIRVRRNPSLAMRSPNTSLREKLVSLKGTFGIISLFLLVIGGIYLGVFSPNEAAGGGAFGAVVIALIMRKRIWKTITMAARETVSLTGAVFFIVIGAMIVSHFVTSSNIATQMSKFLTTAPIGKWGIFCLIMLFYLILGCMMNVIPAVLITLPMIFPTVFALGFDPIWFGVVMVIMMEMGQITPPIGINVFAIASVAPDVPMGSIFRGTVPFLMTMALAILVLSVFPKIATYLPNLLK